jgi:hypothetical protein
MVVKQTVLLGCNVFALIGYSFFGKIRNHLFTAALNFQSNCVFCFLDVWQHTGATSMLY